MNGEKQEGMGKQALPPAPPAMLCCLVLCGPPGLIGEAGVLAGKVVRSAGGNVRIQRA